MLTSDEIQAALDLATQEYLNKPPLLIAASGVGTLYVRLTDTSENLQCVPPAGAADNC